MQLDWSKSTVTHPDVRKRRERELQEWLAQDNQHILDNNFPPLTAEQEKRRFINYNAMLTENPIDLPLPTDDFEYTDQELKQCCLKFPVTVEIHGDLLHRFTLQFLQVNRPGVPFEKVEPRLFQKVGKMLRSNWRRHQAKIDRYRTTEDYLKEVKMSRARFHRYVRRKWVEEQRQLMAVPVIDVSSEDSDTSLFSSLNNTIIMSQPRSMSPGPPPSQVMNVFGMSDSYTDFYHDLVEQQKSTQSDACKK